MYVDEGESYDWKSEDGYNIKKALIYYEKLLAETIVLVIIISLIQRQGKSWVSSNKWIRETKK